MELRTIPVSGHLRTVGARLARMVKPLAAPPSVGWSATVEDPEVGPVRLTGRLSEPRGGADRADAAVVAVHGLGGCAESAYMLFAARAIDRAGIACLRLNLRGADRRGDDYYHAGLTDDLEAAVASPELARYGRIGLLGYSMGGHIVLRYAAGDPDPRIAGAAAVCAPLDLAANSRVIDRTSFFFYRRYLLRNLMEIYEAVAARRPVPLPVEEATRIRRFWTWDTEIVAPRHGFEDAADYYRRVSVAPVLHRLAVRSLLVAAEDDPMIPAGTLRPALGGVDGRLDVRWARSGGHIAFPDDLDLGLPGPAGLESQLLGWLFEG